MEPSVAAASDEVKYCVVCGVGSHRTDWVLKSGDFVACDNHSKTEFLAAVQKASAPQKSTAPPTGQAAAKPATGGDAPQKQADPNAVGNTAAPAKTAS